MPGFWRTLTGPENPEGPVPEGHQPLHIAVECGDLVKVEELLRNPETDVNAVEGRGWTPLYCAADSCRANIVIALLTHDQTDPNRTDQYQWTAVYRSLVWQEGRETFNALLRNSNTEYNWTDALGQAPLHSAVKHRRWCAVRTLVRRTTNDRREDYIKAQIANKGHYRRPFCIHKRQPCRCVVPSDRAQRRIVFPEPANARGENAIAVEDA